MKLSFILIFIATLQAGATSVLAQQVSLKTEKASLKEVLKELKKQTGYDFLYASADLREVSPIKLDFQGRPLKEVLDYIFRDQPVTYFIENKTVLIKKRKMIEAPLQQITVAGRITDTLGVGLPGVSVRLKNSQIGTVSDVQGNYSITVPESGSTLVFSYLGFATQEHVVNGKRVLNIIMLDETIGLKDVVVIGYGAVQRKDLTGSVATVDMADLIKAPVTSFDQALAGRIAGVQVSSADGQPGGGMDIVIRGANSLTQSNSPLYVIDGFPIEDPDNAALNPDDIESINVLKDASATAIYGSRGANGVVIIETKKGKIGKPVITLNSSLGFQQVQKQMDMMSPFDFVKYQIETSGTTARRLYTPADLPITDALYNAAGRTLDDYKNIAGTDWQDLIFRQAPMQIHNVAIRGGNAQTKYAISGSIANQEGIILNTGSDRYQGRVTIDQTISKKLKAGLTANYSYNVRYGQPVNQGGGNSFTSYLLYRAWAYRPVSGNPDVDLTDYDTDPDNTNPSDIRINPVTSSNNEHRYNRATNFLSNIYLDYEIVNDLKLRMTGSVSNNRSRNELFYNSNTPLGSNLNTANNLGVNGSVGFAESSSWSNENTLTYNKTFNRSHKLTFVAGLSFQEGRSDLFGFSSQKLPNENLVMYGLDEGMPYLNEAEGGEYGLVSYFGRANYNFKSRYLLTATFRADGSSKFNPGNKWGYFPSAAIAWDMKNEDFMKGLSVVSASKLRMSYGVTGNNRIGYYEYYPNLSLPLSASYSFNNNTPTQGIIISKLGNPKLKWESTEQLDIGYDLGLFKNRIEFTFDAYKKTTRDLLLNADMPSTSGYSSSFKNIGAIKNMGLEFTVNTINIQSRSFTWESSFNINFNRNEVIELTRNQESMFQTMRVGSNISPLYTTRIGYPAGMFFGYIFDGIYQIEDFDNPAPNVYVLKNTIPTNGNLRSVIQPGHIRYKDINDDGTINDNDMTIIGRGQPIHTGGFANNFSYKGFNLNVFMQWSYGNQIYNANRLIFDGNYLNMFGVNQYASVSDRWTPENRSNTLYKVGGYGPGGFQSTRVLEDGSYIRIKTVSFGYSLPKKLIKPLYLSNLNLNISGQNLFTITNYSGMDPETSTRHSVLTPGFDYSAYPQARTIVFGINAAF